MKLNFSNFQHIYSKIRTRKAWIAFAFLIVGISCTIVYAIYTKNNLETSLQHEFSIVCNEIKTKISTRLYSHALLLRSGSSFISASENVTRSEWKTFIENSKIRQNLPGIQGVGYIEIVNKSQLQDHLKQVRNEISPDYAIHPTGDRDKYTSVIYFEPVENHNILTFGYDLYTEPISRNAMDKACDYDVAALTGKVILKQKDNNDLQAGIFMYVPVYRFAMPVTNIIERREAIMGWVYSPYRMTELMMGILGQRANSDKNKIRLQIYDNDSITLNSLLYDSHKQDRSNNIRTYSTQTISLPIFFNTKKWTLVFSQTKVPFSFYQSKVLLILISGFLISFLMFILILSLLYTSYSAQQIAEQLTKELKESEQRFYLFMDYLPAIVSLKDNDGKIIFVNKYAINAFGITNWLGKNSSEIYKDDFGAKLVEDDLRVLEKGYEKVEMELVHLDEKIHNYETHRFIIPREGHEPYIGGISIDITDRIQAEKVLEEERERLAGIIKGTKVATWEWNIQTGETIFNERWAEIIGYTLDEISPVSIETWQKFTHPDDLKASAELLEKHFNGELDFYEIESRMKHKDGSWVWILDSGKVTSFTEDGKPLIMLGSHLDITSRKKVEEELKASREQLLNFTTYLQNVREDERKNITLEIHDSLAQFLVALKMDIGIYKRKIKKESKPVDSEEVISEMEELINKIDNIINTARRIMNGLRPEQLELLGLIEATEVHLKNFEENHHIICKFENSIENLKINNLQSLNLFRIIQESLNNILKHAMATSVIVRLSIRNDKLVLTIIDNGIGFDKTSKLRSDAYGLIGMKERVKLLNGNFKISSKPDEGTKVNVEIPIS